METCSICGKEFKNKAGLTLHKKSCKEVEPEVIHNVEAIDAGLTANQRVILKLMDKARSTFDAKARYDIECMIKELMKSEG